MTSFQELVFFLTTAQEEQNRFLGERRPLHADTVNPSVIGFPPGVYHVKDGGLVYVGTNADAVTPPTTVEFA
jgi:hypothetical protein